jgi:hypothetical protein
MKLINKTNTTMHVVQRASSLVLLLFVQMEIELNPSKLLFWFTFVSRCFPMQRVDALLIRVLPVSLQCSTHKYTIRRHKTHVTAARSVDATRPIQCSSYSHLSVAFLDVSCTSLFLCSLITDKNHHSHHDSVVKTCSQESQDAKM